VASNSKEDSRKAKGEKVQISHRRRIWKENHTMHKMQTAWHMVKHAMNMYMILMPHHLLLQSQRKSEVRKVSP
jgi:hypothetical protein